MFAFDPVLELAGHVSGVFADFKHGDDDDFNGDLLGGRCAAEHGGEYGKLGCAHTRMVARVCG
ncbi:MAG: hypothetical protein V4734_07470 [Terriglobus sp.]